MMVATVEAAENAGAEEAGASLPSDHPTDRLIRELIASRRKATAEEVEQIFERLATAPFDQRQVVVRVRHRGLSYAGLTLGARASSLDYHLIQRVVVEQQWPRGTTRESFLADIARVVHSPAAKVAVYERRGGHIAVVVVDTDRVLPAASIGPRPERQLLVVYSADRAMIVTTYQLSEINVTGIPKDVRWLERQT
jgi:hypothetical protein